MVQLCNSSKSTCSISSLSFSLTFVSLFFSESEFNCGDAIPTFLFSSERKIKNHFCLFIYFYFYFSTFFASSQQIWKSTEGLKNGKKTSASKSGSGAFGLSLSTDFGGAFRRFKLWDPPKLNRSPTPLHPSEASKTNRKAFGAPLKQKLCHVKGCLPMRENNFLMNKLPWHWGGAAQHHG